MTFIDHQ